MLRHGLHSPAMRGCLTALVALLVLGGCRVSPGALSTRAVNYNVAAETARNQMLLLNILRARDQKPLAFTGLSRITGSVRAAGGVGGSGSGGGEAVSEVVGVSPNFSVTDSPTFDVAVLDSQEFTRGIMTPVRFDLLEYFWDQGFSPEVLLYLMVERIEVSCAGGTTALTNDPTSASWETFREALHGIADTGAWETRISWQTIGPPLPDAQVHRLANLVKVADSNLVLSRLDEESWQLRRPAQSFWLAATVPTLCGGSGVSTRARLYDTKASLRLAPEAESGEILARLVLRSPQSILFYLGELTRPGRGIYVRERVPGEPMPERRLFHVARSNACDRAVVRVAYSDDEYLIPDGTGQCHGGRSTQALSLTALVLSLQQSSANLPVTSTVRIIGQ